MDAAAWVCLTLPLAAAAVITLAGTRIPRRLAGYVSTLTTMGSFGAAVVAFFIMVGESPEERAHSTTSWTWLSAGKFSVGFTLLTDQLSVMILLIVTGVGSLNDEAKITRDFGSPRRIGELFLTDHLLAFEVTSIVLLVAAVAGVVLGAHARVAEDEATVLGRRR